jgi:EpsI family protein
MTANLRLRVGVILVVLLAARLLGGHVVSATPLSRPFEQFPVELSGWRGHEAPSFDEATERVLNADGYLNRVYEHPDQGAAGLFVAYYGSQEQGEAIHSPQNCLPGTGWTPVDQSRIEVTLEGMAIPVNRYVVEKRGDRQLILYWFQGRGRVVASEYLNKAYLFRDALVRRRSDGALVRVTVPLGDERRADASAQAFVREVFPRLEEWLP